MTTVVNNPGTTDSGSNSSVGIMVAVVFVIVLAFLFFIYGIPAMRSMNGGYAPQPQQQQPQGQAPQINVPDKIDVNVTNPK